MSLIEMKYTLPKISIIVPVYNGEKYIGHCIESLLKQNISTQDYEIITIDDGSSDLSMEIVNNFNCNNIVQIRQKNHGVSSARNRGIEVARGEYLLFVDADDTVEEYSLNTILSELQKMDIEILILNSYNYDNGVKRDEVYKFPKRLLGKILSGVKLFKEGYFRGSVWGVVFKRQFIIDYNLLFSEKIKNGEDTLFLAMSFLYASFITHLDIDYYKVNNREGSASKSWDYNRVEGMLDALGVIEDYLKNNSLTTDQHSILYSNVYTIISNTLFRLFSIHRKDKYNEVKKIIRSSRLYPIQTQYRKITKYKIYLLNLSIDLFCFPILLRQLYRDITSVFPFYRKLPI